jgi:hypothetical protein
MASEQVRDVVVRRHVFTSERPFPDVLDGIFGGISQPDIEALFEELPGGGTRVAYDTVTSEIAPYGDAAASQVAERLDTEVLVLLRQATGVPASTAS